MYLQISSNMGRTCLSCSYKTLVLTFLFYLHDIVWTPILCLKNAGKCSNMEMALRFMNGSRAYFKKSNDQYFARLSML